MFAGSLAGMPVRQRRVTHHGMRCRDVVPDDLLWRGELSGVHAGRPAGHAAQPWGFEGTFERGIVAHHETKFLALVGPGVAERPEAVEPIAAYCGCRGSAPAVGSGDIARRRAGVVELPVTEERPVVAAHARRLADEQPQTARLIGAQHSAGCCIAAKHGVDVAVQPRRFMLQRLLVCRDGLADVCEHARQPLTPLWVDSRPGRLLGRVALGPSVARQPVELRQRPEERLVIETVVCSHQMQPTTLVIPGIGTLMIVPGDSNLADLAREHGQFADEHRALLQKSGLARVAEAEARDLLHQQKAAEAKAADKSLGLLVPKGLEALTADLDATQARQAEAGLALGRLPAAPEILPPSLNVAERDFESAREAADQATALFEQARQRLNAAASALQAAMGERDSLLASLDDPLRKDDLDAKRLQLAQAVSQEAAGKAAMDGMQLRIGASRPDILRQDFDRFRRSAEQAERQHQARDRQISPMLASQLPAGGSSAPSAASNCGCLASPAPAAHPPARRPGRWRGAKNCWRRTAPRCGTA